jgi:hypothetical protein
MKRRKSGFAVATALAGFAAALFFLVVPLRAQPPKETFALRPPAVSLVTSDPYLSIWSAADRLTDDATRHWTRREQPLVSLIRIDGAVYRLMGNEPRHLPVLRQAAVRVFPTRSVYDFDDGHIHVTLTFLTPGLPEDLDVLARPLTYLTWGVRSVDGIEHAVSIFDSTSALLAVNTPEQKVEWVREAMGGLTVLRVGTIDQTLLQPAGDDTRIDWGYAYVAAPTATSTAAAGSDTALFQSFVERGTLPDRDDTRMPRAANDQPLSLAIAFQLGSVGARPVSRHLMIAYDEIYAIKFLGRKLRPFWRRNGATPSDLLQAAERDYAQLVKRCEQFDLELMADLTRAGGARYAQMAALAYRQALAGCGMAADANGQPLFFTKENSSNGCIATVDVIYPAAPQFLLMGPAYAKALVAPALVYSTSPRWKFPFAPHDVGVYPQANGQVYGGGESSTNEADMMPVEESANLILLCAAIARMEGNAGFSAPWWPQLSRWEAYLEKMSQRYGVPLDSRTRLTKTDWSVWSATLASDQADFEAIVSPIHDYLNATTARLPFVDSYVTDDAGSDGMRARPVIGGVFIKMLEDPLAWKKWSSRDRSKPGTFAPAPPPPRITEISATSQIRPTRWRFTFLRPGEKWAEAGFDDGDWKEGNGGFGTAGTPGAVIGTTWNTPDIWLRRELTLPAGVDPARLQFLVYHDEDAEIFVSGVLAARESGYVVSYQQVDILPEALRLLKPGARIVLAVHCHQTEGGQGIDVGLVEFQENGP